MLILGSIVLSKTSSLYLHVVDMFKVMAEIDKNLSAELTGDFDYSLKPNTSNDRN